MLAGVVLLLLVDIIWVGSSELTDVRLFHCWNEFPADAVTQYHVYFVAFQYIFHRKGFKKPFFTTYFKTSSFMVYLAGFIFYTPWKKQCVLCCNHEIALAVS